MLLGSRKTSYFFYEKGGARKRADVFLQRKTEQSELYSDVALTLNFNTIKYAVHFD